MRLPFFIFLGFCASAFAQTPVDWSQPPVGCIEEIIPQKPDRPCLDLTQVKDPMRDWPALPDTELEYWKTRKRPIFYCRAEEVFRREGEVPGSQSAVSLETAWMFRRAVENFQEKVDTLYGESRRHGIPPQILAGELYQESLLAELGIYSDGGNYSCGVGQVNLLEWCHWANGLTPVEQGVLEWGKTACSQISPGLIKPFYDRALKELKGRPEYELMPDHFKDIEYRDVVGEFPSGSASVQKRRYRAALSFVRHCTQAKNSIGANAHAVATTYKDFVPDGMKSNDIYPSGEKFQRTCEQTGVETYYPLHTGWLLAVAMFNAGSRSRDALAHYHRWTKTDLQLATTFAAFKPTDLIETFYWTGAYSPVDDKIHFETLLGGDASWTWFKACVLQRHVARVIQNAALPGQTLASSLEGASGCAKSVFDPQTGKLVKTSVPADRQISSGRK